MTTTGWVRPRKTLWAFEPASEALVGRISIEVDRHLGFVLMVDEILVSKTRDLMTAISLARFLEDDIERAVRARDLSLREGALIIFRRPV